MLPSPLQSRSINRRNVSVISPLRRHINTGNLAIVLFVALALLSTMRGKETETTKTLDYHTEVQQGYLEVFSATDEFDDGGVPYHAHSSYAIYTIDGKVLKTVENHISRSDELPEIVALPVGPYIVDARSDRGGYVRVAVVIKAGYRTTLNLELGQQDTLTRLARAEHS
jgi:hypothetical protein